MKKNFYLKYFGLLLLFIFLTTSNLTAQEYRPEYDRLEASASNYYPELNEVVTLSLTLYPAYDEEKDISLGFSLSLYGKLKEGIELVEGNVFYEGEIKKGIPVTHQVKVRFTQKKVHDLYAFFQVKYLKIPLYIYVDGAREEDSKITWMKHDMELIKKNIAYLKQIHSENKKDLYNGEKFGYSRSDENPKYGGWLKKENVDPKRMDPENQKLFKKIEKEYDTLKKEWEKLRNRKQVIPAEKKKKSSLKLEKTSKSINSGDKLKFIANKKSKNFFYSPSGTIIDFTKFKVSPEKLGTVIENSDHSFYFKANGFTGTGIIYAYKSATSVYSFDFEVFSDVTFSGKVSFENNKGEKQYAKNMRFMITDSETGEKIHTGYLGSFADFNLYNINSNSIKFEVGPSVPNAEVHKTDDHLVPYAAVDLHITDFLDPVSEISNVEIPIPYQHLPVPCSAMNIINVLQDYCLGFNSALLPVIVNLDYKKTDTYYDPATGKITISAHNDVSDQWDESVIVHEYGHLVMDNLAAIPPGTLGTHYWAKYSTERTAYSEGWATFFSCLRRNNPVYTDYEPQHQQTITCNAEASKFWDRGYGVEAAVCQVLWDLHDGANEYFDTHNALTDKILSVMTSKGSLSHYPYTMEEFTQVWGEKGFPDIKKVCDFHGVKLGMYKHNIYFPQISTIEKENYNGATVVQMLLNFLGVSKSQTQIHTQSGASANSYMNMPQAKKVLEDFSNPAYDWLTTSTTNSTEALHFITKWLTYDMSYAAGKPSNPKFIPGMVPFNGSYNDWVVINGVQASRNPWDKSYNNYSDQYYLYGFWVTKPNPYKSGNLIADPDAELNEGSQNEGAGLGSGESFLVSQAFLHYYKPINGKYIGIIEPPKEKTALPIIAPSFTINYKKAADIKEFIKSYLSEKFNSKNIDELLKNTELHISPSIYDEELEIEYEIITFTSNETVLAGLILQKNSNKLFEFNIPNTPVSYSIINSQTALNKLSKSGVLAKNTDATETRLIYKPDLSKNRFYPVMEIKNNGSNIYVTNNGKIVSTQKTYDPEIPKSFSLKQNFPNPFNPTTKIEYEIAQRCDVLINIFNLEGQLIKTLINEFQEAGKKSVIWDGKNSNGQIVASGIYVYTLSTDKFVESKKMVFIK